jgi:hypothetical protein
MSTDRYLPKFVNGVWVCLDAWEKTHVALFLTQVACEERVAHMNRKAR